MSPLRRFVLTLGIALFASSASAHEEGHGPVYSEKGPAGGALTAFVKAADAELGRSAPAHLLLESIAVPNGGVRLRALSLGKRPLAVNDDGAKLIVVFKDGHVVEKVSFSNGETNYLRPATREFVRGEVILSVGGEKYVADF